MVFDFKKAYKELYQPKCAPAIVDVPKANYIAVRGKGDPNEEEGEYQRAINILYAIAYTIKMSYKGEHKIEGFYEYVVPPLEGFWWQDGVQGADDMDKSAFRWISAIRLPEFVTKEEFAWAAAEASRKKKADCSFAEYFTIEEGLCVQMLHIGSFDKEAETIAQMDRYIMEQGCQNDITKMRRHHEIYLTNAKRTAPEKWKTIIRQPIRKI